MSYKNFMTPDRGITGRASELKAISSGPSRYNIEGPAQLRRPAQLPDFRVY